MWDERYSSNEYAYGKRPNDFLASVVDQLPKGKILCLAEGEGRNAVYLAQQGNEVLAVDASSVGLEKAEKLAEEHNAQIETVVADLSDFEIEPDSWDVVVSIFCHVPPALRQKLHASVVSGLRSGGVLVLEAYTPAQLNYRTGGPPSADMMMSLNALREELEGLDFKHALETEREVIEGSFHTGMGSVVQLVAVKP